MKDHIIFELQKDMIDEEASVKERKCPSFLYLASLISRFVYLQLHRSYCKYTEGIIPSLQGPLSLDLDNWCNAQNKTPQATGPHHCYIGIVSELYNKVKKSHELLKVITHTCTPSMKCFKFISCGKWLTLLEITDAWWRILLTSI